MSVRTKLEALIISSKVRMILGLFKSSVKLTRIGPIVSLVKLSARMAAVDGIAVMLFPTASANASDLSEIYVLLMSIARLVLRVMLKRSCAQKLRILTARVSYSNDPQESIYAPSGSYTALF